MSEKIKPSEIKENIELFLKILQAQPGLSHPTALGNDWLRPQ